MQALMSAPLRLRAVQVLALNTLIALGITVFDEHGFGRNFITSQCIGLSIWALLEAGQRCFIADWSTQSRRLVLIVPLAVALGYALGTVVADLLLNGARMSYLTYPPRKVMGFLLMSLLAGAVLSYVFLSREQLASARERGLELQRQAAESQLKLLQTQLEPHMLFNTLANLRALIGTDPARATAMLDRLIAYLRATLQASRSATHSLQAEFDRLHDYLSLMAVRMGPRLAYTLDLPAELAALPVPTLLLQPLVENSIKHGLEPKVDGGSITVRARRAGSLLTLEVADTGVGVESDQPALHGQAGFGLAQVRERLSTCYGTLAGIEFGALAAGGTLATLKMPIDA